MKKLSFKKGVQCLVIPQFLDRGLRDNFRDKNVVNFFKKFEFDCPVEAYIRIPVSKKGRPSWDFYEILVEKRKK